MLFVVLAAIMIPVFATARDRARSTYCLSNEKQLGLGLRMYMEDYDNRFPMASNWQLGLTPYVKNASIFHCPSVRPGTTGLGSFVTDYAYNTAFDAMKEARLASPATSIVLFETTNPRENSSDAIASLPSPGRHHQGNNFCFSDGHAKWLSDNEILPQVQLLPDDAR